MQMADEVPEGSGADGQKPARSSKLLGITHEFICILATCGFASSRLGRVPGMILERCYNLAFGNTACHVSFAPRG